MYGRPSVAPSVKSGEPAKRSTKGSHGVLPYMFDFAAAHSVKRLGAGDHFDDLASDRGLSNAVDSKSQRVDNFTGIV